MSEREPKEEGQLSTGICKKPKIAGTPGGTSSFHITT